MKIQALFNTRVPVMAALLGMAVALGSCSSEENISGEGGKTTGTETDKNLTTFVADAPNTRTTMSNAGVFKWQTGDKIWVKDDDNVWQVSSNAPTGETDNFKFKVPGKFTGSNTYTVYYPGRNGNQDKVTISATQSQADPDTPAHVGESGDCGWADATKGANGKFNFTLDHKAAFLVFSPYCNNNPVIQNNYIKLTKIEITSDNDLVGIYTLDPANATAPLTSGTSTGTTINLTTQGAGGSPTENGFSVPTAATPATNASYVVIKPGTHTLKVHFWLKDYVTNVEGAVTKEYPSFTYAANTYYTMSSELKVTNYTTPYFMWDAQQPYWKSHEWDLVGHDDGTNQPTVNGQNGSAYPQSNTDQRWYNETHNGSGVETSASRNPLFTSLPNANEMSWYAMKGDPRWDDITVWTTMNHLYKGGMWFKKKANITNFSSIVSADGSTDLRTKYKLLINSSLASGLPSASAIGNYFYLPALGYYYSGRQYSVGSDGYFWSSSAREDHWGAACCLWFYKGRVYAFDGERRNGYSAVPFE